MKEHAHISSRLYLATMMVAIATFTSACGMWSRHLPEVHGEPNRGTMDEALGNMNAVMGMDMGARQQHMMAAESQAMELGENLFNDASLGTNGQACSSCHPGGGTTGGEAEIAKKMGHGPYRLPIPSLIGAAARFPKYKVPNDDVITLPMMNNNCIRMFMKGKRLPLNSPESYYLAKYVTSFSNGDAIEVGNN